MADNFKDMCRLCATSEDDKMKNIFTDTKSEMNMADVISKYLGLTVEFDDMFPKVVCDTCTKKVFSFHEYAEQCSKVQSFFIKLSEGDPEAVRDKAFQNIVKSEYTTPSLEVEVSDVKDEEEILVKQEVMDYGDDLSNSYFDDAMDYPVSELLNTKSKKKLKSTKRKKTVTHRASKMKLKSSNDISSSKNNKPDPNLRKYFSFSCFICKISHANWFRLKAHIIQVHELTPKVQCICGCIVKSKTAIYRHVAGHNDPTSYACDQCSRITKTQEALDRHKMRHIPKPDRVYNCSGCTKVFNSKENLKSHERVHIPVYERYNYPCTICGNKFTTKSAVVGHTRAVHEKIKRYVCDICGYACSTGGELIQHRAIHSEEKLFPCSRCPKKFKTGSNLKAHLDTHDSTSYPCGMCDKILNSRRTLRKHLLVHDDLCRHVCSFCNKAFKRRQTLKVHLTSHTGDTPVQCPWCPQKFAYSSACRTHKQRCHPEQLALQQPYTLNTVNNLASISSHFQPNCDHKSSGITTQFNLNRCEINDSKAGDISTHFDSNRCENKAPAISSHFDSSQCDIKPLGLTSHFDANMCESKSSGISTHFDSNCCERSDEKTILKLSTE